jgi:hypothetical protein
MYFENSVSRKPTTRVVGRAPFVTNGCAKAARESREGIGNPLLT